MLILAVGMIMQLSKLIIIKIQSLMAIHQISIGFVYRPVWYTNTDNMEVLASFSSSPQSFIAGYWPDFNKAKGLPVIIKDKNLDVILIGLEICHRAQPEYLFRLLVNAIHA